LLITAFHYLSGAPAYLFFYHDLVKPLSQHAIQFSILVFIALLFLIENLKETKLLLSPAFGHSMIAFLSLFLLLLSSKLIISFYIFYLTSIFLRNRINKKRFFATYLIFITAFISIAITPNPIGNRFRSMITGNSLLFEQQKFNPGVYFNGVQFRLLEWRFSFEILNEQKAWIKGVTPADAQSFLDKKYTETNMFTGIPGTQNHGFLGYHTHNQFLQSLLENGLPGLVVFLLICFSLFKMAWGHARHELKWLVTLLIVYCFTDAPFETQYGIVIFTLFPLLFYLTGQNVLKIPIHAKIIGAETPKPIAVKQPN
jgi:O-antigen ligase